MAIPRLAYVGLLSLAVEPRLSDHSPLAFYRQLPSIRPLPAGSPRLALDLLEQYLEQRICARFEGCRLPPLISPWLSKVQVPCYVAHIRRATSPAATSRIPST
ncbi:hypothetical protein F4680DRAFT_422425 [Xylaria scruposa]|nr:hypothetical protein F4680DRAFT_422425 [Xylaria scruposa]